jgi:hypothetical protein
MVPGWSYSYVAALESGTTSWTQILDAARIGPDDDPAEVTAAQLRGAIERLISAGRHRRMNDGRVDRDRVLLAGVGLMQGQEEDAFDRHRVSLSIGSGRDRFRP